MVLFYLFVLYGKVLYGEIQLLSAGYCGYCGRSHSVLRPSSLVDRGAKIKQTQTLKETWFHMLTKGFIEKLISIPK
jgi:uncharacterized Fe-S cluster-containing protein